MRFALLYRSGKPETNEPPRPKEMEAIGKLMQDMVHAGVLVGTEGFEPSTKGARIRINSGKFTVSDGPFTERYMCSELSLGAGSVQSKSAGGQPNHSPVRPSRSQPDSRASEAVEGSCADRFKSPQAASLTAGGSGRSASRRLSRGSCQSGATLRFLLSSDRPLDHAMRSGHRADRSETAAGTPRLSSDVPRSIEQSSETLI